MGSATNVACKQLKWVKKLKIKNKNYKNKNYNNESDKRCFLEVDVQYLEHLHNVYNDLPFLPARMKIEKTEKCLANLNDKIEYVIQIRKLESVLNQGLVLKNVFRAI